MVLVVPSGESLMLIHLKRPIARVMEHIAAVCSKEICLILNTFNQSTHHIIFLLPTNSNYPHRYTSGATTQVLLFGVVSISLKDVAPSAHTMCGIVCAR